MKTCTDIQAGHNAITGLQVLFPFLRLSSAIKHISDSCRKLLYKSSYLMTLIILFVFIGVVFHVAINKYKSKDYDYFLFLKSFYK